MSSSDAAAVDPVRRIELQATGLSIGGGLIHAMLTPTHLDEWWGYGLFFFFVAALQIIYGIALGGGVFSDENWKGDWYSAKRNFILLGIVGNLGVVAVYLISRTTGIPFFGPGAGTVEPFGFVDVASKLIEVLLIVWLARLLRRFPRQVPAASSAA